MYLFVYGKRKLLETDNNGIYLKAYKYICAAVSKKQTGHTKLPG